jgi:phage tail sheath protein FI
MTSKLMTPGVYIEEKNAFPNSIATLDTAVPVFIGYTEFAEWRGKSLVQKPTRITSYAEYVERFGKHMDVQFRLEQANPSLIQETFMINGSPHVLKINDNNTAYLYNSMRLFFGNGGGNCYILSIGTYAIKKDKNGIEIPSDFEVKLEDFIGSATKANPFELLKKELEPTLIVIPDAIILGEQCYTDIYPKLLAHCAEMQSCFAILDLAKQTPNDSNSDIVNAFRTKLNSTCLNYGAAYYPWLNTTVVQYDEVTFENLDASVDLENVLPASETKAIQLIKNYKAVLNPDAKAKLNFHRSLIATSKTYTDIVGKIRNYLNELPPSGAMAGIYSSVDNSRGVWKAPANVSFGFVNSPTAQLTKDEQEELNIDAVTGKSINAIRSFPGNGVLVWGARTLDGNSQEWRYISVRRTMIMVEQSIKLGMGSYVFEPNDANTWVTVKSMIENFLNNLWKQGALAGAKPEHAYNVQVGLGTTMTANDILDGTMRVTVMLALLRPAEFIQVTLEQQMQKS